MRRALSHKQRLRVTLWAAAILGALIGWVAFLGPLTTAVFNK